MKNRYAVKTAVSSALTTVRHEQDMTNQELFTVLFDTVPSFIPLELDGRTKLAKEKAAALVAFAKASNNLIKYMN